MIKDPIRAMVLAAGIGSRLAPLSEEVPKPLIRIAGKTIMDYILLLLKKHGITNIISNTHHLGNQIENHFTNIKEEQAIDIQFVYEEELSGVAGGIRRCQDFLRESTACIIMGDALTDIDLSSLYQKHKEAVVKHNCLATVAQMQVVDTSQFGVIVTESLLPNAEENSETGSRIVQFQEKPAEGEALSNWANTGIYFFEPGIYDFIPSIEEAPKYDVAKDLFPKLLKAGEYIQAISVESKSYWADLGTPSQYRQSLVDIKNGLVKLELDDLISNKASIDTTVKLLGTNQIEAEVQISQNSELENCIVWENVEIGAGSKLRNCIVGPRTKIAENSEYTDEILISSNIASKNT